MWFASYSCRSKKIVRIIRKILLSDDKQAKLVNLWKNNAQKNDH